MINHDDAIVDASNILEDIYDNFYLMDLESSEFEDEYNHLLGLIEQFKNKVTKRASGIEKEKLERWKINNS